MTNTDILHADIQKIGVWLRWAVPIILVGLGGMLKYTRDIEQSLHALVVSDTQMREMVVANRTSLNDKYSRHLGIHEELARSIKTSESCPRIERDD